MSDPSPLDAFLSMGGYAGYVWPAYAIALLAIAGMAVRAALQLRQWRAKVAALEARRKSS